MDDIFFGPSRREQLLKDAEQQHQAALVESDRQLKAALAAAEAEIARMQTGWRESASWEGEHMSTKERYTECRKCNGRNGNHERNCPTNDQREEE